MKPFFTKNWVRHLNKPKKKGSNARRVMGGGGGVWVGRGMLKLELIDALILRPKIRNNICKIVW